MERLTLPNTDMVLYPGSIVILAEYPYSKWIVNHGWYTYKDQQQNGWYFKSITDGSVLSLSNVNVATLTIVAQGEGPHMHHFPHPAPDCGYDDPYSGVHAHPYPSHRPMPGPCPTPGPGSMPHYGFTPREADQLRRAYVTVDTIKQRDALDDGTLPNGKLCRVNNVNGRTKYYAYDVTTCSWIEQPIDFMTQTEADQRYVSKEGFDWELMSDPTTI